LITGITLDFEDKGKQVNLNEGIDEWELSRLKTFVGSNVMKEYT